jgi:hypothetical protein
MSIYRKLAEARRMVKPVVRSETADTGKYEYSYSTLGSVMKAVDEACATVHLTWWQEVEHLNDLNWQLVTVLLDYDSDDPPMRFGGAINTTKADPQANGSALTYARRYSLVTLFGLNQIDDDGALAHRAIANPTQRTPAEIEVRKIVAELPDSVAREDFQAQFIETFGCTLTNLPESRHGDALTWAKEYRKPAEAPA